MTNLDRLALLDRESVPVVTAYENAALPFFDSPERIHVRRPADLAHQEALTRALANVTPRYESIDPNGYADAIAESLGLPLRMVSFGPTAADKVGRSASKIPARSRRADASGKPAPGTSSF
jgi:hypothetical protein